jgi:hypothetical protein
MPRFFFHVHTAQGVTRDEKGLILPDVDAARVEALRAIEDLPGRTAAVAARESILIEIADEAGQTVLNVPLPAGAETPSEAVIEDQNDLA